LHLTLKNGLAPESGAGFASLVAKPVGAGVATGAVVMDVARALQLWADLPVYQDYLRRFAASYGDAVDVMLTSMAAGERAVAAALAHKVAGAAGNLALLETYRLALKAERVLATGVDPASILEQLRRALAQAMAEIATFAALAADEASPLSVAVIATAATAPADLHQIFSDLMAALDGDNPGPVEPLLAALVQRLGSTPLAPVVACVRGFDFRGAEAAVRILANAQQILISP
jgi:hypothetical protein